MFDRSWSGLVLWCCSHWGDLETGPLENYSTAFISQANKANPSWRKCLAEKRGAVVTHLEALETCALFYYFVFDPILFMDVIFCTNIHLLPLNHSIRETFTNLWLQSVKSMGGQLHSWNTEGIHFFVGFFDRKHMDFTVWRFTDMLRSDATRLFYYHTMHHWRN